MGVISCFYRSSSRRGVECRLEFCGERVSFWGLVGKICVCVGWGEKKVGGGVGFEKEREFRLRVG